MDKIIVIMMENNDIFLADGYPLVHLTGPKHKKYSTTFFWAMHLVRTCLMTEFSTPLP